MNIGVVNVRYKRAGHISEPDIFRRDATPNLLHLLHYQLIMDSLPVESRITLALDALKKTPKLSLRDAAQIYHIPPSTLSDRRAGRPARRDIPANSRKLTDLEE